MTSYTWTTATREAVMLLNFEPPEHTVAAVVGAATSDGWTPNPYLIAARVCWVMSTGDGRDLWAFRAERYAVRGGYRPESLGIRVRA